MRYYYHYIIIIVIIITIIIFVIPLLTLVTRRVHGDCGVLYFAEKQLFYCLTVNNSRLLSSGYLYNIHSSFETS